MTNALAVETSPYLRQHAENPVDWLPWGPDAFARAHAEDKPLLVSIGYSSCHWCHVMERESFEDARTAELMNESFVCVKVDREERPDVDALYMEAVQGMTGRGGWPLNVFLTPEQIPFYGGTYFPPDPRQGMPSWTQVLPAMARGGIHDQLGGGFSRYSVDATWTVPHFEKMLYDNALLARAYLHGWQRSQDPRLLEVARDTLEWALREMRGPEGGFYSALD